MKSRGKKHLFGTVKVGEKGQIVIPKDARDMFGIRPGSVLMLVGDEKSGLAIITDEALNKVFEKRLSEDDGEGSDE